MPPILQKACWPFAEDHLAELRRAAEGGQAVLLIRYGEISLKGKNRPRFEGLLRRRLRQALAPWRQIEVQRRHGRFFVTLREPVPEPEVPELLRAVGRVFGVVSFSPAYRFPPSEEALQRVALLAYRAMVDSPLRPKSFKVQSRRSNKSFPWDSMQINQRLGADLLRHGPPLAVDVHRPDFVLSVEVGEQISIYTQTMKGPGGLPVGSSGRAALLLSGGIDSPVAGWLAMKRGLELDCIHFHSFPYTSEQAQQKCVDLATRLSDFCPELRLYLVRLTEIQQAIRQHCPAELWVTVMRRMMMRVAGALAETGGFSALITGESLGQVASQTLESLTVVEAASPLPVLRPLIAWDKEEIVQLAKSLGTYSISVLPYEDCCTVFLPPNPATRPSLNKVERAERALPLEEMVAEAVSSVEIVRPKL